jgi:long-chain acyl-CoA synthetase
MRVDPRPTFPAVLDQIERLGDREFLPRRHSRGGGSVSYAELVRDVRRLAAGLIAEGIRRGDHIALIAENRYEWLVCDLASASIGAVDVPRGVDTATPELQLILDHSGAKVALVETAEAAERIAGMRSRLPALERVVLFDLDDDTERPAGVESLREWMMRGDETLTTDEGRAALAAARAAVTPDDLLTIVYTSGTTAEPKGVMLTQDNVLANLRAVQRVLHFEHDDIVLSVLPAWHMYERIIDYVSLVGGSRLLYTDRRRLKNDIAEYRPTIFAAVPRIWEMLHDGIVAHVERMKGGKRGLLRFALRCSAAVGARRAGPLQRISHALLRRTLLPKLLTAVTGGRMRIAVSGGGALPAHVDACLVGIGLPLLNGYGLTETSPVANVRLPSDNRVGTIGPPLPDTQIEIRDPEGRKLGPGQVGIVWIRGPQVMRGYYKNPDRTERVLRDGWFDSGDLGLVEPDGHVRITGRAKDTIVLAGGENVEPEPLELQLKTSPLIQQAVVLGQDRKTLGALFVPDLELLEERIPRSEWNCENGVIHGPAVTKALRREIDGIMTVDNGFRGFERIAKFRVLEEPLTPENGLLTATLKVKRHVVAERFAKLIEDMYAQ